MKRLKQLAGMGIVDALAVAGVGSLLYGLWLMYPPLAWVVGGLILLWIVWVMAT